jgi:hypothetical protein
MEMKLSKIKKLLLLMCISVFVFVLTGCSETINTNIKIKSSGKANCTLELGLDDELLQAYASVAETTTTDIINQLKAEGFTYSKKTSDGIEYNMFSATEKNAKLSDIETILTTMGYTNVCLTKNYFYATYDPSTSAGTSTLASIMSQSAELSANSYDDAQISVYIKISLQFNSKVKTTNGKLSSGSKKVKWTIKDPTSKTNFYASTSKVKKTAKTTSVKNNKSYKAGKKIKVSNPSSLVRMTLDGKKIKNNTSVKTKGSHTLTIWSKNGKVQNVTFKIK